MRKFSVAAAILLTLVVLPGGVTGASAAESASVKIPTSCRKTLHFDGAPYGVLAQGVNCHFAIRWTKLYQNHGKRPRHWSCVGRSSYTDGGTCQDRRSRHYFEYYIQD